MKLKRILIKFGVKGRRGKIAEQRIIDDSHTNGIGA